MSAMGLSRRAFLGGKSARPLALFQDSCFAKSGIICQSCGDVCRDRAIRFVPMIGAPARPELNAAACTGCGECVAACPAGAIAIGALREARP